MARMIFGVSAGAPTASLWVKSLGNVGHGKPAAQVASGPSFREINAQIDEFRRPLREPVNAAFALFLRRVRIDELIKLMCRQLFEGSGIAARRRFGASRWFRLQAQFDQPSNGLGTADPLRTSPSIDLRGEDRRQPDCTDGIPRSRLLIDLFRFHRQVSG